MDADNVVPTFLQLSEGDILNMTFGLEDDAFRFYNSYASVTGFSVRKDSVHRDKVTHVVYDRVFVCSCEGFRKNEYLEMPDRQREHRPLTRCGCLARLRIKLDNVNSCYVVTNFVKDHNHLLVPFYGVSQLRSHRHVDKGHKDEAHALRSVGVKPSTIMDVFTRKAGGYHSVGFTRKDLYNDINRDRREGISTGDAKVALGYLYGKKDGDPLYFYEHTVDGDNCLEKLFWTDGRSRAEFTVFGDVLIFDATYKTNSYKFPLIILAGANNHHNTCIFDAALVQNETIESYTWVLRTFLKAMYPKRPISVVTDGDRSMHAAIAEVLPDARHRWHLQRNASTNVKTKGFNHIFGQYMSLDCSIDEFEDEWRKMVVKYDLERDKWIADAYEKRHMWAEAYLRGHFFGGVKSTQRCEGMNAFLNRLLGTDRKLIDFVRDYHWGLEQIRINNVAQEVKTNYTKPVLKSPLVNLEDHASKVFTREVFKKIRKQIELQAILWHQQVISHFDGSRTYVIADMNIDGLLRHVLFQRDGLDLSCDCKRFDSIGILCKHMIYVLKCEGLNEIPPSCINKRWTAEISKDFREKNLSSTTPDEVEMARHGYIFSKFSEMGFYAKKTSLRTKEVIDGIANLTARAKELCIMQENTSVNEDDSSQHIDFDVLDTKTANPKGRKGENLEKK